MTDADFVKRMAVLAQMCRFDLSAQVLEAYDRLLSIHGYEKLCRALDHFLITRSSRDPFPSIADLDAAVYGKNSDSDRALVLTAAIYRAVGAFGWPNADEARGSLGEQAWSVVKAAGGWAQICRDANETDPGIFKAQLRDLARAVLKETRTDHLQLESTRLQQIESSEAAARVLNLLPNKMLNRSETES